MKELAEYRVRLLARLEAAASEFRTECLKTDDPFAPFDAEGWTIHQIAVHTRDVNELVYGLRARRTGTEENPEFSAFDGEIHMSANYNLHEPLKEVLDSLVENVRAFVEWLQALPIESWSRTSRHATLGSGLTLQAWVEKDLAHMEEHLETVKNKIPGALTE